jgi:glycolate oxidase iron-sulfur subunit
MQTNLAEFIRGTPEGDEADAILRKCVHCGFCTATCPTYQLLGDELDGPRGRIYLIKQVLEGHTATEKTQGHLDRCLTCRSCETTCPSGVDYHRLLDIGRRVVEEQVPRPASQRALRRGLRETLGHQGRFTPLLRLGQMVRGLMPAALRGQVPARQSEGAWPEPRHERRMLVLQGCVQPGIAPNINAAAARVLDRLGISLIRVPGEGCCGALNYHLDAQDEGLARARRNIDAWWPEVEAGAEAVVVTASGCGAFVKEYGHLLRRDPVYGPRAARIDELSVDIAEVLAREDLSALRVDAPGRPIAFHSPCTLQHGLRLDGVVEGVLGELGFDLAPVPDPHLCCGSAGTYSIFQKAISTRLRDNKLTALQSGGPGAIATANIGCLTHLQGAADVEVAHWIELVDRASA